MHTALITACLLAQGNSPMPGPGRIDVDPNRVQAEESSRRTSAEGGVRSTAGRVDPEEDIEAAVGAAVLVQRSTAACVSPRRAVRGLLHWLQPERLDRRRASQCIDTRDLADAGAAANRATQIKAILDARGLYVHVEQISDDADFVNDAGDPRHVLFPSLPQIYVQRVGDRWLWSRETVAATPALYRDTFLLDIEDVVDEMPPWARIEVIGIQIWQVLGLLGLLLLAWLVARLVIVLSRSQGRRLMRIVGAHWGETLLTHVANPVGVLAGSGFMAIALPVLRLHVQVASAGRFVIEVAATVSGVVVLYRSVDLFAEWLAGRAEATETKLDDHLVPLVRRAAKIAIVAMGSIFVLQNLGVNVGGLLAGMGLGGLAFALAAKDTVANLFGSATIFASRPFQIGDWVTIDGTEGVVETVGFRSTRIRTFYNSLISVPNSRVADAVVDNYGARQYRRMRSIIGLTYDTTPEQMEAFVQGLRGIISTHPSTRKDYHEIHFYDFGDSSLNVLLYFFFEVGSWTDELRGRQEILLQIMRLADALGVEFAFPTQTVHVETLRSSTPPSAHEVPQDLAAIARGFSGSPGGPP